MLVCGDCRNPELVKKLIGSQKIRLILTDPPYGVGYVENKKGFCQIKKDLAIENDNINNKDSYKTFTRDWLNAAKPYLAIKNSCYIFNSDRMIFALKEGRDRTFNWLNGDVIPSGDNN